LVVVDADGHDDRGEGVIVGREAAGDFLRGTVESANGEKSVGACADQKGEEPAGRDEQEEAEFFGAVLRGIVFVARRGSDVCKRSRHTSKDKTK
jgi:hypothetical protein